MYRILEILDVTNGLKKQGAFLSFALRHEGLSNKYWLYNVSDCRQKHYAVYVVPVRLQTLRNAFVQWIKNV